MCPVDCLKTACPHTLTKKGAVSGRAGVVARAVPRALVVRLEVGRGLWVFLGSPTWNWHYHFRNKSACPCCLTLRL